MGSRKLRSLGSEHAKLASFAFYVPGVPVGKGSFRALVPRNSRTGKVVVLHDSARTASWQRAVALGARPHAPRVPLAGPVEMRLTFRLPRPRSHQKASGGLREGAPPAPIVKPDLDKLTRLICDALTGVLYRDDCQVVSLSATKSYGEPGVHVHVLASARREEGRS